MLSAVVRKANTAIKDDFNKLLKILLKPKVCPIISH